MHYFHFHFANNIHVDINYYISRVSRISLRWFSCGSSTVIEFEFGLSVFVEGRKPENPEANPRRKARTNNNVSPHIATGRNRTQATSVGGERSHHCAIPAFELTLTKNDMRLRRRQSFILMSDSYF